MSTSNENTQQTGQKEAKKSEEPQDWIALIQDFIKNPVTTGITGLAAGYLLGTFISKKDIESIKEEHKQQMQERDEQFKLLVGQIRATNKLIASKQMQALPLGRLENEEDEPDEEDNTLKLEENQKTKVYKYHIKGAKKKKHVQLQG